MRTSVLTIDVTIILFDFNIHINKNKIICYKYLMQKCCLARNRTQYIKYMCTARQLSTDSHNFERMRVMLDVNAKWSPIVFYCKFIINCKNLINMSKDEYQAQCPGGVLAILLLYRLTEVWNAVKFVIILKPCLEEQCLPQFTRSVLCYAVNNGCFVCARLWERIGIRYFYPDQRRSEI